MARKQPRNIGDEILEGLQAVKAHYEGKITLRTHTVELPPGLMKIGSRGQRELILFLFRSAR